MVRPTGLQNTSMYFALRAIAEAMFKIVPDDFVEPNGSNSQYTNIQMAP
jgi:hypothetical protein